MNAKQIWQTTIERLQTKVQPAVFATWFQGTAALTFEDGIFVVRVPTTFARAHLEGRFLDLIRSILVEVAGGPLEVRFVVAKESPEQASEGIERELPPVSKRSYRVPKSRSVPFQQSEPMLEEGISWSKAADAPISSTSTAPDVTHMVGLGAYVVAERSGVDIASGVGAHRSMKGNEQATNEDGESVEPALSYGLRGDKIPAAHKQSKQEQNKNTQLGLLPLNNGGLLNNRYTFSTFIVGKSNQLAHAASRAVAENPGRVYNPLFFYGGVGLGKTHLLHAIGHVGESAGLNVLYVTSEKFTNEIVNAIRFQKTEEFRTRYRQIDILLVDDIQFIAGKESTEEEFFHTFNTLYDANKQIVVTSDRPPKAIHSLQDRLRSRFEWGLLADVHPPEYEHRLAILRSKAESLRFAIPAAVMEYIARPDCSSVRELEGALNRVIAYATLHDAPLSVNLAAQALEHIYSNSKPVSTLTLTEILEGICRYYNVDLERLKSKQRDREIAWPRQVAMYVMREETSASLLQIGTELGGRDHTTIMHGWEKVRTEVASNDRVRREIAAVLESLHR